MTCLLLSGWIPFASSQTTDPGPSVTGETATPTPGVEHSYINLLSETVDPSSGSVNVSIPLPAPTARGITLPISLSYHSAGVFHTKQTGSVLSLATFCSNHDQPLGNPCGWTYTVPTVAYSFTTSPQIGGTPGTCSLANLYTFTDAQGIGHNLALDAAWTSSVNTLCKYGHTTTPAAKQAGDEEVTAARPALPGPGVSTVKDSKGSCSFFNVLLQWVMQT